MAKGQSFVELHTDSCTTDLRYISTLSHSKSLARDLGQVELVLHGLSTTWHIEEEDLWKSNSQPKVKRGQSSAKRSTWFCILFGSSYTDPSGWTAAWPLSTNWLSIE